MREILGILLPWLAKKAISFVVILLILVAGAWITMEFRNVQREQQELRAKEAAINALEAEAAHGSKKIEDDRGRLKKEKDQMTRLAQVREAFANKAEEAAREGWKLSADAYSYLAECHQKVGWYQRKLKTKEYWDLMAAEKQFVAVHGTAQRLESAAKLSRGKLASLPGYESLKKLQEDVMAADRELANKLALAADMRAQISAESRALSQKASHRLYALAKQNAKPALGVLVAFTLVPIVLKAFLYYCVAPWARRLPAIRLVESNGSPPSLLLQSATSIPVTISRNEEVLVRQDCIQAVSGEAKKSTKWFLNHRLPFSSLASGMYWLTRIRCISSERETVGVSTTKQPLTEVALLELPDGCAAVVFPHTLAGVVKAIDRDVTITKHWRLTSIHSWITMQLRFLVVHGPCKLIVKGCRGVKADALAEGASRMINQNATIGFTAEAAYSAIRCETFLSYVSGTENLFNDFFSGPHAVILYEQVPMRSRGGATGKFLEGGLDAMLKIFGI